MVHLDLNSDCTAGNEVDSVVDLIGTQIGSAVEIQVVVEMHIHTVVTVVQPDIDSECRMQHLQVYKAVDTQSTSRMAPNFHMQGNSGSIFPSMQGVRSNHQLLSCERRRTHSLLLIPCSNFRVLSSKNSCLPEDIRAKCASKPQSPSDLKLLAIWPQIHSDPLDLRFQSLLEYCLLCSLIHQISVAMVSIELLVQNISSSAWIENKSSVVWNPVGFQILLVHQLNKLE
mmetsp:Transcript_13444/g.24107  ORF Transcript_13444/g.24107 Transcript_13444/m.24107 type:complete len:228 (-) Transcript_13444:524-1207(-)